jgi:DnaJ family protein A protein 2
MNFNKNYYGILGVPNTSTEKEIKKAYYKLSFTHHPDKGGDPVIFAEITEAYDCLSEDFRTEYDLRSKFGKSYDETKELLDYEFENAKVAYDNDKLEKDWNNNDLNIVVKIDDLFNGKLEYERWVVCKECKGTGRDTKSKIEIKDENGNILKLFDGSDGCDFCEGTGKDPMGNECGFCTGKGKVGWAECNICKGERRYLGKQKLEGIKFPKNEKSHRVDSMGHFDKFQMGMVGHLWLVKSN